MAMTNSKPNEYADKPRYIRCCLTCKVPADECTGSCQKVIRLEQGEYTGMLFRYMGRVGTARELAEKLGIDRTTVYRKGVALDRW